MRLVFWPESASGYRKTEYTMSPASKETTFPSPSSSPLLYGLFFQLYKGIKEKAHQNPNEKSHFHLRLREIHLENHSMYPPFAILTSAHGWWAKIWKSMLFQTQRCWRSREDWFFIQNMLIYQFSKYIIQSCLLTYYNEYPSFCTILIIWKRKRRNRF